MKYFCGLVSGLIGGIGLTLGILGMCCATVTFDYMEDNKKLRKIINERAYESRTSSMPMS